MSSPGRRKKSVDKEQLQYLRSLRFTWEEIGSLLGVSYKTLQRRAKEWNIETYSTISDETLDTAVTNTLLQFPSSGEVMIRGYLQAQKVYRLGIHISHSNQS